LATDLVPLKVLQMVVEMGHWLVNEWGLDLVPMMALEWAQWWGVRLAHELGTWKAKLLG
jgi:hypothetical protein